MKNRVFIKAGSDKQALENLISGFYIPLPEFETSLYDRVFVCFFCAATNEAMEVPCQVVGRRFEAASAVAKDIKLKAEPNVTVKLKWMLERL